MYPNKPYWINKTKYENVKDVFLDIAVVNIEYETEKSAYEFIERGDALIGDFQYLDDDDFAKKLTCDFFEDIREIYLEKGEDCLILDNIKKLADISKYAFNLIKSDLAKEAVDLAKEHNILDM